MRVRGRALISRLSEMSEDQQKAEVSRLSIELADVTKRRSSRSRKLIFADAAVNLGAYAVGATFFPFSPALFLIQEILKVAQKAPALDRVISEIELAFEEQTGRNADLTFLSKASRVAEIKAE